MMFPRATLHKVRFALSGQTRSANFKFSISNSSNLLFPRVAVVHGFPNADPDIHQADAGNDAPNEVVL
jgi:hypothetical protein